MTDARFSGGSVGLVIGHVAPEALLGGPIALVENGDSIIVDVNNDRLDCLELNSRKVLKKRTKVWQEQVRSNGGIHPAAATVTHRMLKRMRSSALPALLGGGMTEL